MHSYTHEYKRVTKKTPNGNVHVSQYLGSRCHTQGCNDNRNRAVLPLLKENDGVILFPAQSRTVQK